MTSPHPSPRFAALDGLRGVAAMAVVFSHTMAPFDAAFGTLLVSIPFRPVRWLYDGLFAVFIFWVLSGFVIAQSASRVQRPLVVSLLRRWARLGIPMAAAVIFSAALGMLFWHAVTGMRVHPVYEPYYDPANFTLQSIVAQAAGRAFLGRTMSAFDPVLWTMHVELIGSCAVYVLYRFTRPSTRIYILPVLVVLLLAVSRPTYAAVATGALLRELWASQGVRARWPGGVLLGGLAVTFFIPPVSSNAANTAYWIAAAAVVYAVLASERMQALLSTPMCQFLGRISFALYLVHFPVTGTVGTLIDSALGEGHVAQAVTFPIVVALSLAVAYLGTVAIDEPFLRALHRFPNLPAFDLGRRKKIG